MTAGFSLKLKQYKHSNVTDRLFQYNITAKGKTARQIKIDKLELPDTINTMKICRKTVKRSTNRFYQGIEMPQFIWKCIYLFLFFIKKKLHGHKLRYFERISRKRCVGLRILVLASNAGIGNAVEATPLVQAIRILWPSCQLTFLHSCGDLFDDWCVPDRVITNLKAIQGECFDVTFSAYLHEDIDVCKDLCSLGRVHALNKWQKKWLLKPEREYYVGMLKSYGYKGDTPPCYVNIKRPEKVPHTAGFRICIASCGRNEAMWKYKKWPHYSELISILRDQYPDLQVCVVGTKDDDVDIEFDGANVVDCRSVYSLCETAWLLKHSSFAIGNDCGPMHIASAVNTSSIVIFGPTCILKNNYPGKVTMLYPKNIKCWPCQYNTGHLNNCDTGQCIKSIVPEMVLERLDNFFDTSA